MLQALAVAGLLSSFLDRSLRDQTLTVAHALAGAGLVFVGSGLLGDRAEAGAKGPASVVTAALVLALVETTWFNWPETALRAAYTAVALYVLTRKTSLPTA